MEMLLVITQLKLLRMEGWEMWLLHKNKLSISRHSCRALFSYHLASTHRWINCSRCFLYAKQRTLLKNGNKQLPKHKRRNQPGIRKLSRVTRKWTTADETDTHKAGPLIKELQPPQARDLTSGGLAHRRRVVSVPLDGTQTGP